MEGWKLLGATELESSLERRGLLRVCESPEIARSGSGSIAGVGGLYLTFTGQECDERQSR